MNLPLIIRITDKEQALTLADAWATHVISILDTDIRHDYDQLPQFGASYSLSRYYFDDVTPDLISREQDYEILASIQDMKNMLSFTEKLTTQHKLLIHCHAGVSRSPAAACGILCQHGLTPEQAVDHVLKIRAAYPNEYVITLMDQILKLQGKLIEACQQRDLF